MPWLQVRVRNKLSVKELSVRVIFLHHLHSLLVAGCPFIRSSQSVPDVVVLHDRMVLPLEQSRSLPFRWNPELEARQPRVRGAIGVLEHAIAEPSGPPKLKKK